MDTKRLFALTITLTLAACGPELDEELLLEELDETDLGSVVDDGPDGLADPTEQQPVSSCDLGLPDLVYGGPMKSGTASGVFSGIPSGTYTFTVTPAPSNPPLQYWAMDVDDVTVNHSPPTGQWPPFSAANGGTIDFFMQAFSSGQPGWIYEFDIELRSHPGGQLICSDTTALELLPECGNVGYWWTQPWPIPWHDTANCYVAPLPAGSTGFVWNNGWYVTPTNGTQCSIGTYDGANCHIGTARAWQTAFIWDGNMYYAL